MGEGASSRSGRQRTAAAALARAALLEVDLARPADGLVIVGALGTRRGARAEVVADATRLLGRALSGPVMGRARRAAWLLRNVPVAVPLEGQVVEDRLDLVWEEAGGLVVVRVATTPTDRDPPPLPPDVLGAALGRPVRELLVLDLSVG